MKPRALNRSWAGYLKSPAIWLTLLALAVLSIYVSASFRGPGPSDTFTDAALARNIAQGKGFVAGVELPYRLAFDSDYPFQELRRPLLQPFITSIFFRLFGISDFASILSSMLFFLLSVPVLYLLARALFGAVVALVATLLFIFHAEVLYNASSGLTEPAFAFFLLVAFLLLIKVRGPKGYLALGAVLGMAALTRDAGQFYMPAFLIFGLLTCKERRWANALSMVGGFALLMLPHWIRTYLVLGSPFLEIKYMLLAGFTERFPEYSIEKSLVGTSPWPFILDNPGEYVKKLYSGFQYYYASLGQASFNPYILSFFVVGLLRQYKEPGPARLRLLLLALIVIQVLVSIATVRFYRYIYPLMPLAIIFAADFMVFLVRQFTITRTYRLAAVVLISLAFVYPLASAVYDNLFNVPRDMTRDLYAPMARWVEENVPPDGIVFSDRPQIVGWYGDRTAVHIPYTLSDAYRIVEEFVPVDAIVLTQDVAQRYSFSPEWNALFDARGPVQGFRLVGDDIVAGQRTLYYVRDQ